MPVGDKSYDATFAWGGGGQRIIVVAELDLIVAITGLDREEPWYGLAVKLVDEWDAPAFDPDFEVDPLESFVPLMRKVFHDTPVAAG